MGWMQPKSDPGQDDQGEGRHECLQQVKGELAGKLEVDLDAAVLAQMWKENA